MKQLMQESFDLAGQLAALPFKAARQAVEARTGKGRPAGAVMLESLQLGEGLARLPFRVASAALAELTAERPDLEQRIQRIEEHLALQPKP